MTLVKFPRIWSRQRALWQDAREVPRDPTASFMQMMCISPESESPRTAYDSATFSPFHLPLLLAQPAQEKFDIGTVSVEPPAPPIALKSLLFVRDSRRLAVFVLVFSSFHCDTKKLND